MGVIGGSHRTRIDIMLAILDRLDDAVQIRASAEAARACIRRAGRFVVASGLMWNCCLRPREGRAYRTLHVFW